MNPPIGISRQTRCGRLANRFCLAMFLLVVLSAGCHRSDLPRRIVHGDVTCGGEKIPAGDVLFVPVGGTPGPATGARIVDGQYRAENRGGVPIGKHRVQVFATRATGRKVTTPEGMIAEEGVSIVPEAYSSPQSPLTVEVKADGDGRIDLAIPAKSP